MTFRILLLCLRHPRSWRQCLQESARLDPKIQEWREQRVAAIEATKQELRTMPSDPITAAYMGSPPKPSPQGSGHD